MKAYQAREEVLLPRKGVYASPFDLAYYARKKEQMKAELAARIRIPYEHVVLGRQLVNTLVPVHVSMENSWTISPEIVSASLFELVRYTFHYHFLERRGEAGGHHSAPSERPLGSQL